MKLSEVNLWCLIGHITIMDVASLCISSLSARSFARWIPSRSYTGTLFSNPTSRKSMSKAVELSAYKHNFEHCSLQLVFGSYMYSILFIDKNWMQSSYKPGWIHNSIYHIDCNCRCIKYCWWCTSYYKL